MPVSEELFRILISRIEQLNGRMEASTASLNAIRSHLKAQGRASTATEELAAAVARDVRAIHDTLPEIQKTCQEVRHTLGTRGESERTILSEIRQINISHARVAKVLVVAIPTLVAAGVAAVKLFL